MTATLYINTTVINGSKDVPPIENGAVLVDEAGIIAAIAPLKEIDVPSGTNTVNLGGAWIMPGLINAHAHFFSSGRLVRSLSGNTLRLVLFLSSTRIGKVYLKRIYSRETLVALNAGITTIRDVGSMHNLDLHFRDLFSTGRRIGPRILACGGMITTNGGHGADFPGSTVVSSPRECREAVRERWSNGVDWIKICSTGGVIDARFIGEAGKPYMTPEQIEAVCDEAHRLGLMVASHCESTAGMRDALSGGVDTIEHGGIIEADMIPSFLDNPKSLRGYTSVIPTLAAHSPSERRKLKDTERNRIIKANADMVRKGSEDALKKSLLHGIKAGIGDDATLPGVTHYNLYRELINFQEVGGLTPLEVIDKASRETALIIGVERITGTLDTGKSADFIVLDKNPLEDLKNLYQPRHVIIRGHAIMNPVFPLVHGIDR